MLQIVICEDNQLYLNNIANSIQKILKQNCISGKVVLKATGAGAVEEYLKHNEANLFFLDIDLKGKETGFTLAEKIREKNLQAYIVFITCHFEYVLQAFKVQTFDFLAKPVNEDILEQCILRIYKNYMAVSGTDTGSERSIEVKSGPNLYWIKEKDIVFIERQSCKTIIYTTYGEISCYIALEELESKLKGGKCIRCHKSFVANKAYIREIRLKEKEIMFETGHKCYIGPKYKKEMISIV